MRIRKEIWSIYNLLLCNCRYKRRMGKALVTNERQRGDITDAA